MKKPSRYPILDNRPIDQWKVTELKEELKRRRLTVGGLKQDLIKRLYEAIRSEREAAKEENENGVEEPNSKNSLEADRTEQAVNDTGEGEIVVPENPEQTAGAADGRIMEANISSVPMDSKDTAQEETEDKSLEKEKSWSIDNHATGLGLLAGTDALPVAIDEKACDSLSFDIATVDHGLHDDKMERENKGSRAQQDSNDIKPPHEDVKLDSSNSNNQVSEVSTNLGFLIKSNSISTDFVSISEKNDLEDNIITKNVKLEHDVKSEMVQPSSSNLVPDGGKSHPTDVEEPYESKVYVEDSDNNITNADMSHKIHSADLGSSEKLNLDQSSGDDSMDKDALESKEINSSCNFEEVGEMPEKSEVTTVKGESPFATIDIDLLAKDKSIYIENKDDVAASSEKRKLLDQETILKNEPSKRQRRWKSESFKIREPQISNNTLVASAKDMTPSPVLRRNLSWSNYVSATANVAPSKREVPPSTKAPTNSLRIDRFLRPFTLKAVQELLSKTGTFAHFWMDNIKTHCYVTYSSVEEAVETRNAIYNLQWPPNGGRTLIADFVDPQEVKIRVDLPPQHPSTPTNTTLPMVPEPPIRSQPSPCQQNLRQQPTLPPPPPISHPDKVRKSGHRPPLPLVEEKVEAPMMTLDDLFRKTKATPRVYYLPLSEKQVSTKLQARHRNSRQ